MAALLELPAFGRGTREERDRVSEAFQIMLEQSLVERNIYQVGWWIADLYFQGLRSFDIVDYRKGQVEVSYEDEDADLTLRWDEPLTKLQTEIGRLSRLDVRPKATKRANSLESLRDASLTQVLLDHMLPESDEQSFKIKYLTGLCMYGTQGQAAWRDSEGISPLDHVRELVPAWQLLGFPAGTSNPTDVRATGRTRLFPTNELFKLTKEQPYSEEELEIVEVPYGAEIDGISDAGTGFTGQTGGFHSLFDKNYVDRSSGRMQKLKQEKPARDTEKMTKLRELWINGPKGTVARYIAMAGSWVFRDVDYIKTGKKVPFPIGISRYHDTGRFYGRSFSSKVIPFALELESLFENLIENSADMNRFGYMFVPSSMGLTIEDFKATTEPRVLFYDREIQGEQDRVDHVQVGNTTDFPGRVFNQGVGSLDRTVAQGPLFAGDAPGRSESGESFKVLADTGSTHLLGIASGVNDSYVTVFRHMIHNVKVRAESTPDFFKKGLELTKIENSIAGVKLDGKTGKMVIESNSIPDPWSTDMSIQSSDPINKERRRQEALLFLQSGMLSELEFIIMNYKEGWGYPIGNKAVWENYVKAVLYNLMMFNDGQNLGELPTYVLNGQPVIGLFNPAVDKSEVHLLAIEDFVSGPEFALASQKVQDAFYERILLVQGQSGQVLPDQMPTLEQAAVQAVTQEGAAQEAA